MLITPVTSKGSALVLWILVALLPRSAFSSRRMHNIYWNTTNPMFRIDTTDNIIDVNTGNLPWEYDQVSHVSYKLNCNSRDFRDLSSAWIR